MHETTNTMSSLLAGAAAGAGLMYLLDPEGGNRRRGLVRDKVKHAANVTGEAFDTTWRDMRNRAQGLAATLRSTLEQEQVDDATLRERIRARLGFLVRHPGSIEVSVEQGRTILSGPVLADEVDRLFNTLSRMRGVKEIDNRLEVHAEPGNVPGLQGEPARPPRGEVPEFLQTNWSPTMRLGAGTLGAGMVWYGAAKRDVPGTATALIGAALIIRALTNVELKRLTNVSNVS